ncbi:MAG TPA: T9SS type A sorting domain-containing protein, partial [Flavitalea sp.]|nr:T9SS type A sorting domain-containing protein [Flavitalea sp.]
FPSIAFTVTDPCPGMIAIKWSKPAGVDTFIVTRLIGNDMIPVTTTTDSSFIQTNLSTDTAYWYAVQSIIKGIPSMRSGAKAVFPIGSNCFLSSYNGDLMLDSVSLPESGRQYTSSHRTANEPFSFFIHNRDDSLSAIPIFIKTYVNNVWYCTDTINSALPANVVTKITSKYTLDLSSPGVYTVVCTMENTGDPDTTHHTFSSRIRILANDPVTLPHLEDFSSAKDTSYGYPGYFGLEGAEHWDYETSYPNGKLHVNNNGGNSFVSLEKIPDPEYNQIVHSVKGTFNFVNIDTSVNIRMSAKVLANPDNNFYLFRLSGSDTSSSVYISGNATYVNISKVLRDAKQIPSSSLQVQFYWDSRKTQSEAPNFLDSIYFFSVNKDAAVEAVTLENSGIRKFMIDTFRYRVLIRNQTPNVTGAFTAVVQWPNGQQFSTPVLSLGKYAIDTSYFQIPAAAVTATNNAFKVWIELAGDEVRQNDTVTIAAPIITPLIDTFPYLQSFESGPAGWTGIGMLTLSDKPTIESSPVKAANGNFFWHPNNLPESPPLTTNLISPSFDLRKLNKPAISFSFAENLRKGIDSAFLEVSYNGGKSFTRLKPAYSINWHDYKNDSLWSDSLKKYWHVATALIPRNDTPVHFRIFVTRQANRFTYPLWPGGIGIDDIHIYDLSNPVASNTTLPVSGQITGAGNGWMEIIRDGKIFAAINMQGQDGGILDYDIVPATGLINYVQGYPLLKRKWVLHFSKKLVKPASVRLYFTDDEAEALLQTQLCNHTELSSAYDFSVIQYSGPLSTINGNLLDNISSSYSIIPSTKFNLIPFDKGYYAEVDVTGSSEYFVAANRADSVMTEIQISSVNKSQTLIQWTNTDTSVVRFELEVARDPVAAREGSFTLLKSLNAPAVTYEVIDTSTSGTNWYRLKVLYSSGCIGYSSIKWSGAAAGLVFRIYPNPSNTGLYTVLPSMPLPGTATWEVTNTIGQTIWRTQTTSAGNYDKVTIDLSSLAISKGIYHLRVSWPGGKQTIKLIRL